MNKNFLTMSKAEQLTGWAWLLIQLLFLPSVVGFLNALLQLGLSVAMLNIILFTIDFIAVIAIFHRYLLVQLREIRLDRLVVWVPLGIMLYWTLSIFAQYLVLYLQPAHTNANNETISSFLQQQQFLMTIGTVILVPVTEETLFRGLLFGTLYKKHPALGYVVSVLVFAAVHVVGYIGTQDIFSLCVSLIQYIPAGLVLGLVYVKANSLVAPILIHAFLNALATLILR